MSGLIKFRLGFFGVPHFPIKGKVARRLGILPESGTAGDIDGPSVMQ